jgi:hypothetical protein
VVIGGDVSVDLWRYERWSLVGDVRPRVMIAAVNSAERSEVPIDNRVLFQPQLALGLWHEVTTNQQRRRGWRGAWVLELEAEEWLHGRDTSPVIGFALGYAFGMCC